MSGNKDDKTFNGEILEEVENTLERLNISTEDFHYIADSDLFTSENLKKAEARNLKLITRMPEITTLAKECIREALENKNQMNKVEILTKQDKIVEYLIRETYCIYEDVNLKCAVCYSKNLEKIKRRTIDNQIKKEKEIVEKLSKAYAKRSFACLEDANKEISKLMGKDLKKLKYHSATTSTYSIEKKEGDSPTI